MKRIIKIGGLFVLFAATATQAQVYNFHDASQGQIPGYNQLYVGQGAFADPGNNIWNGFSANTYGGPGGTANGGPGSTLFFGPNNPYPSSGGNPGNPYAAFGPNGTVSSSGPTVWGAGGTISGGNPTGVQAGNARSTGALSPITLSMNYGFDNGANDGVLGTPSWLLTCAAVVNAGSPGVGTSANPLGSVTLHGVPAGSYNLFLYGANHNNDRGAAFTMTLGGGTALGGITSTINTGPSGSPGNAFVLGANYVEFLGVTPVGGDISFTWGAVVNGSLSGEGDFNGLQLVAVPEPSTMALLGIGAAALLAKYRRRK